jgi:hypothetical protein
MRANLTKVRIGAGSLFQKELANVGRAVVRCDSFKKWMMLRI